MAEHSQLNYNFEIKQHIDSLVQKVTRMVTKHQGWMLVSEVGDGQESSFPAGQHSSLGSPDFHPAPPACVLAAPQ